MFEVTQAALEQLQLQFKDQDVTPIRVYLAAGCGGPRLALALDEQKETDNVYTSGDFTFVVDKALMTTAAPVKLEFDQHSGFAVTSAMKMDSSASSCSSCSSCCGSCS